MLRTFTRTALVGFGSLFVASGAFAADEVEPVIGAHSQVSFIGDPTAGENVKKQYGGFDPAVAFNPREDRFVADPTTGTPLVESPVMLITWWGDDNTEVNDPDALPADQIFLANDEFEIWGRGREARFGSYNYSNQFRISVMGPDDETDEDERARYQAFKPSVAYNPVEKEFLVVWYGDDNSGNLVDDEYEIFSRRVDGTATINDVLGNQHRVTKVGPESETDPAERARYGAFDPKVVFDPTTGGYMLIYRADDPTFSTAGGPIADDEFEIFGQALSAKGWPVGDPFRISTMGDDSETDPAVRANYDALAPALVWNEDANQFMVAWQGDDNTSGLVDNEYEIYARAFDSDGSMPAAQLRVSSMGTDGSDAFDALDPDIAVNTATGEYMVTWSGDEAVSPLVDDEFEIFAQGLTTSGTLSGSRFRVSKMGPNGNADYDAQDPSIAFHPGAQRYQVSWRGDDNSGALIDDEFQIHAQSVNQDGSLHGSQFRVTKVNSNSGTDAERLEHSANSPESIYAGGNIFHFYSGDGPAASAGDFDIYLYRTSTLQVYLDNTFSWNNDPRPTTPTPITVSITVENKGDEAVPNAELWVEYRNDDEPTFEADGCETFDGISNCTLGTLEAGEKIDLTFTIDTSGLEIGDDLGGLFIATFHGDASLRNFVDQNGTPFNSGDDRIGQIDGTDFVSVVLEVKGGSGALLPLIPALMLLWGMAAIRRR